MMPLIKRKSIEAFESRRSARTKANKTAVAEKPYTARYAPVTFSELDGVRYLHFGTEWVQGAMRLRKPDSLELEYAQQMMAWLLFLQPGPQFHAVQLGLGAAALTKFCYRQFPESRTTAVELNPGVVLACRSMFALPPNDAHLNVLEMDAWEYVKAAEHRASADVLQVDLYDATARGPVLDTVAFYRACRATLKAPGVMTINLFGDHDSFPKNIARICEAFENRVLVFPEVHDGNVIALAFHGPMIDVGWGIVERRAADIQQSTGLPALDWVKKLRQANARQEARMAI